MSLATERNSDIKYSCKHEHYEMYKLFYALFRGSTQFVQKVTFEPLMDFKQTRGWKYYKQKLLLSKVFLTKVMKTHNYFFCDSAF